MPTPRIHTKLILSCIMFMLFSCKTIQESKQHPIQISGIYPHLAFYNSQGECGTGAVVPWADRLWVLTYSPHFPHGSDDKLYEITEDLSLIVREESIGGTPANRMIHPESQQLFIGPYVINKNRDVHAIPYSSMQGRHTGNARHLFDPTKKIYYASMEEGFYEVDVNTKQVKELYKDANNEKGRVTPDSKKENLAFAQLEGAHGKGLYSGQGVLVYTNNGESSPAAMKQFDIESGGLLEWDGKNWTLIRRNQFVEVTGPGGIYGNSHPETDPIWATGWDHKSLILGVRDPQSGWNFYRLPKASHSYDGAHGWNTEWPRIRDVGTDENTDYLMTMHGMFWKFPGTFSASHSAGIRPRSAYLKVIGDYTRWKNKLVFGCDDSAQKEFLNKRKHKGGIEGPGQSNSNLWFTDLDLPDQLGPATASGSIWLSEKLKAQELSEPFLFAGWDKKVAWIHNEGKELVSLLFEVDKNGSQQWESLETHEIGPGETKMVVFDPDEKAEWIRAQVNTEANMSLSFNYSSEDNRSSESLPLFDGLAEVSDKKALGGLLYGLGNERRALGISAYSFEDENILKTGYYELNAALELVPKKDKQQDAFIQEKFAIPSQVISIEESSVLIVDDQGRRWRLPLGDDRYAELTENAQLRICREVATERDLFSSAGTFYELPAENADGFAKIRPISSHNFRIHDYASYRGMLVISGINTHESKNEHIIRSDDGKAAVWVGAIDDLWKMGKVRGQGGPWKNSLVKAGVASDPYLIGHYDKKKLNLSHDSDIAIPILIEVDPTGQGPWMNYLEVLVKPGETFQHEFPDQFQARWIRFRAKADCKATAWLVYS